MKKIRPAKGATAQTREHQTTPIKNQLGIMARLRPDQRQLRRRTNPVLDAPELRYQDGKVSKKAVKVAVSRCGCVPQIAFSHAFVASATAAEERPEIPYLTNFPTTARQPAPQQILRGLYHSSGRYGIVRTKINDLRADR